MSLYCIILLLSTLQIGNGIVFPTFLGGFVSNTRWIDRSDSINIVSKKFLVSVESQSHLPIHNLVDNIKTSGVSGQDKLPQAAELLAKFQNDQITVSNFENTLKCLEQLNAPISITPEFVQSINNYIVNFERTAVNYVDLLSSLRALGFKAHHFDNATIKALLRNCEMVISTRPKSVWSALRSFGLIKFDSSHFHMQLVYAIETAMQYCLEFEKDFSIEFFVYQLGHVIKWESLSFNARSAILKAAGNKLPRSTGLEIEKLLFGFSLMRMSFVDLIPIQSILFKMLETRFAEMTPPQFKSMFDVCSQLKLRMRLLSPQLKASFEYGAITAIKSKDPYAIYSCTLMQMKASEFTNTMQHFVQNELISTLIQNPPDLFSKIFRNLVDLKIDWNSFSQHSQQLLVNYLQQILPHLKEPSHTHTVHCFFRLVPPFRQLPEELQKAFFDYVETNFQSSESVKKASSLISAAKLGLKYSEFSESVRALIIAFVSSEAPKLDVNGVSTMLNCLADIECNELSEESKQFFADWLRNRKLFMRSSNNLLESYLNTIVPQEQRSGISVWDGPRNT